MNGVLRWRVQIGLALVGLPAVLLASVLAQQPATQKTPPGQAAQPTQTANMTGAGGFMESEDLLVRRIRFEAGARTYWHTHSHDQVIVAEQGQGAYQMRGEPVKTFVPGEAVFLKAKVPHWHGAAPKAAVVQTTMYSGTIEWGKPVTDEEYLGKLK